MSLPSIQETVVLTNSNFSSYDNILIKELFERFLVFRNFLAMNMISRKFIIQEMNLDHDWRAFEFESTFFFYFRIYLKSADESFVRIKKNINLTNIFFILL